MSHNEPSEQAAIDLWNDLQQTEYSRDAIKTIREFVRALDAAGSSNEQPEVCDICKQPWSAHEMGVPSPYCPEVPVAGSAGQAPHSAAQVVSDLLFALTERRAKNIIRSEDVYIEAARAFLAAPTAPSLTTDAWTPTAENINALPEPIRTYIHNLETNVDPAGMVRENAILRHDNAEFESRLAESSTTDFKCKVYDCICHGVGGIMQHHYTRTQSSDKEPS